jgi:hypothetical protein
MELGAVVGELRPQMEYGVIALWTKRS